MTLNKAKGRMFGSVGWTWNPIAGCTHKCKFCYAEMLMNKYKQSFIPKLRPNFFNDKFPEDESWIFVGSMGDIFCEGVPDEWIIKLLNFINQYEGNHKFLLQSKNPCRLTSSGEFNFTSYMGHFKEKIIIGTTFETTGETPWSTAPTTKERYEAMKYLKDAGYKTFLSLEPLADFDVDIMRTWIDKLSPEAVEVGLENYTNYLPKPHDVKILMLLEWMKDVGIPYVVKDNLLDLVNSHGEL